MLLDMMAENRANLVDCPSSLILSSSPSSDHLYSDKKRIVSALVIFFSSPSGLYLNLDYLFSVSQVYHSPALVERAAGTAPPSPTNETIALYMQVGIWIIVLLLVLASLPRAYQRWRHPSVRVQGMKLKAAKTGARGSTKTSGTSNTISSNALVSPDALCGLTHNLSQANASCLVDLVVKTNLTGEDPSWTPEDSPATKRTYSRVASWGSIFHPVYRYLSRPVWWVGYSVGLSLAFAVYTGTISFGFLYYNLPSFNPKRPGWIFVGQIPFIVFLSTKNNLLGFVLGVGYEKLSAWHRWVGKTMFLALMAHVVGYLILFGQKGKLVARVPTLYTGWIGFAGFLCLFLFSLPAVRTSAYRLFWHTHWIGYILLFVGASLHANNAWFHALAGTAIIALDHICRIFKTTFVTANITAIPELKCTRIEVPQLARGWRAGQHVRLRTVSTQMGFANLFEAHPFTISSVSENPRGEGLILYAKACGDWTDRLYDIAKSSGSTAGAEKVVGVGHVEQSTLMRMVMEGPYGGPGHDVISTFSSAFLLVGGSGITWGLSIVEEIIRDAELQRANTRLIHLVWVVQDPTSVMPFVLLLTTFADRISRLPDVNITTSVHYTRAISSTIDELFQGTKLPSHMHLIPGRPRIEVMINEFVKQTGALATSPEDLSGLIVGCCGPRGLRDNVEAVQGSLSKKMRDSIGGVEVVNEAFGW
ncbi:hypothetical protein FRB97_000352 [Tulasnella sp. 331]|nr:hypothetical protein FRB98_005029 [Tulasnella sp. 332]KAG8880908.1 hypothetical protein FRB97_000352 [Tulasnella sp. 331]